MKKKILVTCLGFDSPHPKKARTWPESVKRKTITTALLSIQIPSLVRKMSKKIETERKLKVCWDNGRFNAHREVLVILLQYYMRNVFE